jgi:hypothetical protein
MNYLPTVIFGLIISGSFFKSAIAANGKPQLATMNKQTIFHLLIYNQNIYLVPRNANDIDRKINENKSTNFYMFYLTVLKVKKIHIRKIFMTRSLDFLPR